MVHCKGEGGLHRLVYCLWPLNQNHCLLFSQVTHLVLGVVDSTIYNKIIELLLKHVFNHPVVSTVSKC